VAPTKNALFSRSALWFFRHRNVLRLAAFVSLMSLPSVLFGGSSRQKAREYRYDLTIVGEVSLNDGLGRQSTDLIETLGGRCRISFIHASNPNKNDVRSLPADVQKVLATSGKTRKGSVLIYEAPLSADRSCERWEGHFWQRYGLKENDRQQIRIAYSMFESSRIPRSWVDIVNSSFDAVIVPDQYLVRVYERSGVAIPVFVIPLGRDLSQFLSAPLKTSANDPFVFATFSLCDRRKNTLKLVQAFARTFGDRPDVELRLYWRACFDKEYREQILSETDTLSNVRIHEGPVDCARQFSRFQRIDCLVNVSTGEGFSIQPREAMALVIPVIATDNTSQSTVCASGLVRSVPATIKIPAIYPWKGDYGVQYDCTIEDISSALLDVYTHYNTYLNRAPRCRVWAKTYDLTASQGLYISCIKPSRVVLGTVNAILPDGIMTTSPELVQKYRSIFRSLSRATRGGQEGLNEPSLSTPVE
jgi:hypothetical protein